MRIYTKQPSQGAQGSKVSGQEPPDLVIRGSGADACSTCTSAFDGTIRAQKEGPTSQRHTETEQMGPCKSVDSALDQDEAELGVLVLAVLVKVLSDGHGLPSRESCTLHLLSPPKPVAFLMR